MDAEADQNGPGEAGQPALSGEGVEPPFQLGYRPELDGMRALSIAAVLLMHAGTEINREAHSEPLTASSR